MRCFDKFSWLPLALCGAIAANAQVITDPGALDSLTTPVPAPPPRPTAPPRPHPAPARPSLPRSAPSGHAAPVRPGTPVVARPAPPAAPAPPVVPPAPPPAAVIPPPAVFVPTLPQPAPPPPPVVANAAGAASTLADGVRITFGTDSADLNPATQAALVALARTARERPEAAVSVIAHAPGVPEDPSSPRRLSLSRALAARAVLIAQGIASSRIYLRPLGPLELGDGPADRVDVTLAATPAATTPAPAK